MLPFGSSIVKAVIYINYDEESHGIEDLAVIIMRGIKVTDVLLIGKNYDESNDDLAESIINEESDSRILDEDVIVDIKNISGINHRMIVEEIYQFLSGNREELEDEGDDYEYIILNESLTPDEGYTHFSSSLYDYIEDKDDTLIPTQFKDIFYDKDINNLIGKFGLSDHMYSKESTLSNAIYTGILFDKGLGY